MDCDIHYAKTNLSKLIKQAEDSEDISLVRRGQRIIHLAPLKKPKTQFGTLAGQAPLIEDTLLFAMTDGDADAFVDGNW